MGQTGSGEFNCGSGQLCYWSTSSRRHGNTRHSRSSRCLLVASLDVVAVKVDPHVSSPVTSWRVEQVTVSTYCDWYSELRGFVQ